MIYAVWDKMFVYSIYINNKWDAWKISTRKALHIQGTFYSMKKRKHFLGVPLLILLCSDCAVNHSGIRSLCVCVFKRREGCCHVWNICCIALHRTTDGQHCCQFNIQFLCLILKIKSTPHLMCEKSIVENFGKPIKTCTVQYTQTATLMSFQKVLSHYFCLCF